MAQKKLSTKKTFRKHDRNFPNIFLTTFFGFVALLFAKLFRSGARTFKKWLLAVAVFWLVGSVQGMCYLTPNAFDKKVTEIFPPSETGKCTASLYSAFGKNSILNTPQNAVPLKCVPLQPLVTTMRDGLIHSFDFCLLVCGPSSESSGGNANAQQHRFCSSNGKDVTLSSVLMSICLLISVCVILSVFMIYRSISWEELIESF